ncbi:hypothetical protein ACOMHN_044755 [Nucella lapillus]
MVKRRFRANMGSGSRPIWKQLKSNCAAVSSRRVKGLLHKTTSFQETFASFTNRVPPKPVVSSAVNERWQVDLINMSKDQVLHNGKTHRYILSIIDTFSRFQLLRPLEKKTSAAVASRLKEIFSEHGTPNIIQWDRGTEFHGKVEALLKQRNIQQIRSSAYHLQSQGKYERSHREVQQKINFMVRRRQGFNWARSLFEIQNTLNNIPKTVLGSKSPVEIYTSKTKAFDEQVKRSSKHADEIMIASFSKKNHPSVYKVGERVLIRYPPKDGKHKRVPRRRYICKGIVEKRKVSQNKYKVRFERPDGQCVSEWMSVADLTSKTMQKEKLKKQNAERTRTSAMNSISHKDKYQIPMTHVDHLDNLTKANVKVLLDPIGDGTCQFAAVSHQLSLFGIYRTPEALHQEAVDHIEQFLQNYRYVISVTYGDVNKYMSDMRGPYFFGDHITLTALAIHYHVQFLIVNARGPASSLLISSDNRYNPNSFLLTLGYFQEERGEHYLSVQLPRQTEQEILASLVERWSAHDVPDDLQSPLVTGTAEPLATETDEAPVTETDKAPATETSEPLATETDEPLATEKDEPLATEKDEPLATETSEPLATEKDEPLATETDEAPATETSEPPATETDEAPATETSEPPATETDGALVTETDKLLVTETEQIQRHVRQNEPLGVEGVQVCQLCRHTWTPASKCVGASKCVSCDDTLGRRRPSVSGRPSVPLHSSLWTSGSEVAAERAPMWLSW